MVSICLGTTCVLLVCLCRSQAAEIIDDFNSCWCPGPDDQGYFEGNTLKLNISSREVTFHREKPTFYGFIQSLPRPIKTYRKPHNTPHLSTTLSTTECFEALFFKTKFYIKKSPHEGVRAAFESTGVCMSSTTAQIKNLKAQLEKLWAEWLKAADNEEKAQIERRMAYHKRTLKVLEG